MCPLAWCRWWDEQWRSVHTETGWWLTGEGMWVCRCNSRVSCQPMSAVTRRLVTSSPTELRIWCSWRNWKKQMLITRLMCCFIISSFFEVNAEISFGLDLLYDIINDWKCRVSRWQLAHVCTTAKPLLLHLSTFTWSQRDEHQSCMSVMLQHSWWNMVSISEILPDR